MNTNAGAQSPQSRQIPDNILAQVLSEHEARLNAIAAQQIQLAIMIEYQSGLLDEAVPDFVMDDEDFAEFRERRFNEMKSQAMEMQDARRAAESASQAFAAGEEPVDLDLSEDDLNGSELDD